MGRQCENFLQLIGANDRQERFLGECLLPAGKPNKYTWRPDLIDFSDIIEQVPDEGRITALIERFGCGGIYRTVYTARKSMERQTSTVLRFWSHGEEADRFVENLSQQYPQLEMRYEFDSEMYDDCGQILLRDGTVIDRRIYDARGEYGDGLKGLDPLWEWVLGEQARRLFDHSASQL